MKFISSSKFISGYLVGAGLMWGFMVFDYIPKNNNKIKSLVENAKIYEKAFNTSLLLLEEKEIELEKERSRNRKIQEKQKEKIQKRAENSCKAKQEPAIRHDAPNGLRSNRVRGIAGFGPTSLSSGSNGIRLDYGPVGGIGYDRIVLDPISIGFEMFTNRQINATIGIDF